MEDIFTKSQLFSIYGGILTKKQKLVYEYHINNDLSFNEIGDELKISRQAAFDLFKGADKKIMSLEKKLNLLKIFSKIENLSKEIKKQIKKELKNEIKNQNKINKNIDEIIKLTLGGVNNGS